MYIIPTPKELNLQEGTFVITPKTEIILNYNCNEKDLEAALLLQKEIISTLGFKIEVTKAFVKDNNNCICLVKQENIATDVLCSILSNEEYTIGINENRVTISSQGNAGIFYGVQTLRQIIRNEGIKLSCLCINDCPDFKNRGFYHDITRGKVPTLETLKELADRAAFYKLNQLQLYIEHTFAFKNHSELWAKYDPITAEEILLLDQHCKKLHIELVPSLATFGHLYHALTSNSFNELCEIQNSKDKPFSWIERMGHHTLDVSNEKSIKFIEEMLEEFIPLFSSNKFNICCDETFDLGIDKSKELCNTLGKGILYVDFLNKIINSVRKHNKEVMFWGDIIVNYPELIKQIPTDVICLNWNYAANAEETNTKTFSQCGLKQYVCPGVSGWDKLMNDLDASFNNINKMVQYGMKYNAEGVLNTDWGDYGHINLLGNSIPGMIYGAALSWNSDMCNYDFSLIDKAISYIEYGDKSSEIVDILRELSRQQSVTFMEIVWWKENKFGESNFLLEKPKYKDYLLNISELKFHEGYKKAISLSYDILNKKNTVYKHRHLDLAEFYVAAEGIALLNSLYLIIKKYDLKEKVQALIHEPWELAVKLEYWLADFTKVWRSRNKESELIMIKDTFSTICGFLRNTEGKKK